MPLKIYYLDDEVGLLEVFAEMLEGPGRTIKTFSQAQELIAAAQDDAPDIFFLDYRLPGLSGDEVAGRLDSKIPRVLISGEIQISPVHRFDRILSKPFKFDQIEDAIAKLCGPR